MMEGMKRKEERDRECKGRLDWKGVWRSRGGGLPSNLSGCGSPLWTSSHRHPS